MTSALLLYGGWEGHEPEKTARRFAGLLAGEGWQVTLAGSLDALLGEDLVRADLIVPVWTMGRLTPEQSARLREAVLGGAGLAGWHGGLGDAFREDTEFQFMVGGQFVAHPGGEREYQVQVCAPQHPVTRGLGDFRFVSEQYYLHVDPSNEVLATTTFDGGIHPWLAGTVMPVAWTRPYGAGRVFYCSLGHADAEFDRFPEAQELVRRGLLWAARPGGQA